MGTIVKKDTAYTAERTDALLTGGSLEWLGMRSRRACYRNDAETEDGRFLGSYPSNPSDPPFRQLRGLSRVGALRGTCKHTA